MPKIDVYGLKASAPCRAVLMVAKAIGVEVNFIPTDLSKGEHLKPEFLKINPQHTIPTIVDNGFSLWESRAIITYLVSQYGKDDTLYPNDSKKKATVDQRLYFDASSLYQAFGDYYYPIFQGATPDPAKFKRLEDVFGFLNAMLEGKKWVAGDNMTVADYSLVATVGTIELAGVDITKFPNVQGWYNRMEKEAPAFDVNKEGLVEMKKFLAERKAESKK